MIRILVAMAVAASLAGCAWEPIRDIRAAFSRAFEGGNSQHSKGEPALAEGIRAYNNGDYATAAREIRGALKQGLGNPDRVRAHKYLAFVDCAAGRTDRCRHEFRLALAIDPHMQLAPAEAGHPIWGPVFRSVKAGR